MGSLRRFDGYDELRSLLDASDEEVLGRLGGPTLVCVPGVAGGRHARLVSCLLHGNEDSGYRAVLAVLRSGARFAFDLWVLIGNVEAASADGSFAHRYLDGQEDFNRVWTLDPRGSAQRRIAAEVLETLRAEPLEAALDLHNTTGHNPPHAIVPPGSRRSHAVAGACSDVVLRWHLRAHTLMEALTPHCPAIAVECGIAGAAASTRVATRTLHRFLSAPDFRSRAAVQRVFEMRQRVAVRPDVTFTFGADADGVDLALEPDLDVHNFSLLPSGTKLGVVRTDRMPLQALSMDGSDVTDQTFRITDGGTLELTRDIVPAMMTRTVAQTERDCYFYIAEPASGRRWAPGRVTIRSPLRRR